MAENLNYDAEDSECYNDEDSNFASMDWSYDDKIDHFFSVRCIQD